MSIWAGSDVKLKCIKGWERQVHGAISSRRPPFNISAHVGEIKNIYRKIKIKQNKNKNKNENKNKKEKRKRKEKKTGKRNEKLKEKERKKK